MVHCYLDGGGRKVRREGRGEGGLITDNRHNFITNIDNVHRMFPHCAIQLLIK